MSDSFDAIVIGGGLGGLCCAGELVLHGARPLLIAESAEVGVTFSPQMVGGSRGIMQVGSYQLGWGGGWWPALVRRLNVPVRVPRGFGPAEYDLALDGVPGLFSVPQTFLSAADVTLALSELFPMLGDAAGELERILEAAFAIPYQELAQMHEVPLLQWLEDQKADEFVIFFFVMLISAIYASTGNFVRENASVYGAVGGLRFCFMEGLFGFVYPDLREGLAIPLAKELERRGASIWKGRHVAQVQTENGRVGSVVLDDGTEVRAPVVALACSNARIAELLDPLPPEAEQPIKCSEKNAHQDFQIISVLDTPAVSTESKRWVGVLSTDPATALRYYAPLHALAPWCAEPGKQLMLAAVVLPAEEAARADEKAIYAGLHDTVEFYNPGYKDAISATATCSHKPGHLWYDNLTAAPKLPRSSGSVQGLWYVGEGSAPTYGFFTEAAASAAILGAREIAASIGRA